MPPNLLLSFKILRDLGPEQVGLYALYKLGLRLGLFHNKPPSADYHLPITSFDLPSRESLLTLLGPEGQRALLAEADEIVAGKFRMFGSEPAEINLTPSPPLLHWTAYETQHATRNTQYVDLKLLWEPARFGWATVLARAYHLTRDEKYAESFWKYTETFLSANPPYLGPNWISAQESALRILSWTFAWSLFREADSTTEPRARLLAESIAIHAERIPPTLIYARSQNNNHLLSEAAGLVTAALVLPNHPRAKKWLRLGRKWFNRGLEKQIDGYGEYSQHSANYHRLMLQLALWLLSLEKSSRPQFTLSEAEGPLRGAIFSPIARKNLARASHWLASILDPDSGGVPNLGANDGAYILPLTICSFADFRPVVQCAARAFLQYDIARGVWDEMSLWLGNQPVGWKFEAEHYLAENLRGRESWAYLRATEFKSRPGHADLLHLDLWWRGLNIARDPGTFSYNAQPPWDNPLTASRFHNTVTVDGRDQMTRVSRFLYVDWVDAYARTLIEPDENILCKVRANHKGWRKLGVEHERTVSVYTDETWLVEDRLLNSKGRRHRFRLHWLLPDWKWSIEESAAEGLLVLESPRGPIRLRVTSTARPMIVQLARAGEMVYGEGEAEPFEGWFSPTYGAKEPALSFSITAACNSTAEFSTAFIFPK